MKLKKQFYLVDISINKQKINEILLHSMEFTSVIE